MGPLTSLHPPQASAGFTASQNSQLLQVFPASGETSTYCKLSRIRRSCSVSPDTSIHLPEAAPPPQAASGAMAPIAPHRPNRCKKWRRERVSSGIDIGLPAGMKKTPPTPLSASCFRSGKESPVRVLSICEDVSDNGERLFPTWLRALSPRRRRVPRAYFKCLIF